MIVTNKNDEIEMMFKLMEYDYLSETQENLIISFEEWYNKRKCLTQAQYMTLKDIFNRAAEKVEWSR